MDVEIPHKNEASTNSTVAISGKLAVGEALSGSYAFAANTGNPTDASEYQWGLKGKTASVVDNGSGKTISQSGVVPSYTLKSSDAGQVLEMSVRAKNGANVYGNTATITTAQSGGGNNTEGGGNGGTIVDESAAPIITNIVITGKLAEGEVLNGTYGFDANKGNPIDNSQALWGKQGATVDAIASDGKPADNGKLPSYTIQAKDAGYVLEVSVQAKNGADVVGNIKTVNTAQTGGGNNTDGGVDGQVVEPYTFTVNPSSRIIGETLQYQYTLTATANGKQVTIPNGNITWSSSNNAIAAINQSGLVTAKASGDTKIKAQGTYNSQLFDTESELTVVPLEYSPLYGTNAGRNATVVVGPPSYSITMQCGEIVDGMGSIGGSGGSRQTINNTDNVTKITTVTGVYTGQNVVGKITFTYKDGSIKTCGEARNVGSSVTSEYTIPDGYRMQGYKAYGGTYVNGTQYIVVLK